MIDNVLILLVADAGAGRGALRANRRLVRGHERVAAGGGGRAGRAAARHHCNAAATARAAAAAQHGLWGGRGRGRDDDSMGDMADDVIIT